MKNHLLRAVKTLDRLDAFQLHTLVNELVQGNQRLEAVLSSLPGGVMVSDSEDRVIVINNPARRLLPLSTPEPVDKNVWTVIASADISLYVRSALEEDRGAPMRDFPVRRRERNLILSCGVLPLVDKGHIIGNMVYVEDVSEQRAEEARLKRAESLASLTTMAAGVAHEIKNPLASMSIHLQLMRRLLDNNCSDPDEMRESVEILEEETERLNTIVSDYLVAVRPGSSHLGEGDINSVIADLVQFLRFETDEAGVNVVQLLDENLPSLALDERAMKMALLNLVKNAVSAMPDGGELRLQTRLDGPSVQIDISDTGTGIPEELLGKVFDPFFTTRNTGSGLGLTVVYKVVREHGGDLQVDSIPGRGTTFRITLPVPQRDKKLLSGGSV